MTLPAPLPAGTGIASASLAVADLDRSLAFWRDAVGLPVLQRHAERVDLGFEQPILTLIHRPGATPPPRFSTGLFHVALLFPTRRDLARAVRHVAAAGFSFYGASDHDVSEAFYLDDPDHNGVELYRDRPADQWEWRDGALRMGTRALDVDQVMSELVGDTAPWTGAPPGTRIGHVHLKVGDLAAAERFYREVIGFDLTLQMHGAMFFSAGRYHHHLGANTWHSAGAPAPPPSSTGLVDFTVQVPGSIALEPSALRRADPWGHVINFVDAFPYY